MAGKLEIDSGDSAWMLVAAVLVRLMLLPGLGLFYGGLVRAKNRLSGMSQVLGIAAVAVLTWVGWNYSLAFSDGNWLIGGLAKAGLAGLTDSSIWAVGTSGKAIPELVFAAFQMTFAAITAALVIGALVERVRFAPIVLFSVLWLTVVYAPLAHMVWASEGLLFKFGAIDFAGGTVVHINAGVAGLARGRAAPPPRAPFWGGNPAPPPPRAPGGAGWRWVGWFGFNAGSALEANGLAAVAMMNTFVAPAAGLLSWMAIERLVSGQPSMLGGASGAVAGLVAITPAAGASGPIGAMLLGALASLVCYGFVASLKNRLKLDDSLDVFGIHGLGGIAGSIGTAVVALPALGGHGGADYAFGHQLLVQVAAVGVAIAWSATGSALCFAAVKVVLPLRHARDAEREGLDLADHGERGTND